MDKLLMRERGQIIVEIDLLLRNGPDKNDSNNGNEHVGMQKRC